MIDDTSRPPKRRKLWVMVLVSLLIPLLGIWFFFLGPKMRRDRLIEKGVHVPGRLLDVEETGTMVNHSPELALTIEFTRPDGRRDTATTDFVPKQSSLYKFQPGAAITAAYDPEDPKDITLVSIESPGGFPGAHSPAGMDADSLRHVADSLQEELRKMKGR
jgi:hypothetical protein